jgi:hypothetical protein
VFADYMAMKEIADNIEHLQDNPLMEAVMNLIPFPSPAGEGCPTAKG